MLTTEAEGGRPVDRAREYQPRERRGRGSIVKRFQGTRGSLHHPSHSQQRFGQRIERNLQRRAIYQSQCRREERGASSENPWKEEEGEKIAFQVALDQKEFVEGLELKQTGFQCSRTFI